MKLASQAGLVLLVNLAIASGAVLPGELAIANVQLPAARQVYDEGLALLFSADATKLKQAALKFEAALKLSRAENQLPLQASSLYSLGQVYSNLDDQRKAINYFGQALEIYTSQRDQVNRARLLSNIGSAHSSLGDKKKALDYYNQALPILVRNNASNIGTELLTIGTLKGIGSIYLESGEQQKALDYYNQALSVARNAGVVGIRPWEMDALTDIIYIYLDLNDSQKALEYADQALSILESIRNPTRKGIALYRIALSYSKAGQHQKSIEYFEQMLAIARRIKDSSGEDIALGYIISDYMSLNQPEKAIEYGNKSLPIFRSHNNRQEEAAALTNIGLAYGILGQEEKALAFSNQALPIARILNQQKLESTVLNNIGLSLASLGKNKEALDYYNQALLVRRKTGDREGENATLNNAGYLYILSQDYATAIQYFEQSVQISRSLNRPGGEAMALINLGALYVKKNDHNTALKYFNQALLQVRSLRMKNQEAKTLEGLANLALIQNNLVDALKNINGAIEISESFRSTLKNDALKTSYFSTVQSYYQLKTKILMQLHQQNPTQGYDAQALETVDQSRARVLRELLIQANAKISKDISPDLLKQEQTLNQTLDAQETQLVQLSSQSNKEAQLTALKQSIAKIYSDRDALKNTIRLASPAYANLQYPKPITTREIQQQLDPDTLMLQYSLGETQSYLWVISNSDLKTYILPKRSDIETTAQTVRLHISDREEFSKLKISATKLTQQILTPAAAQLGKKRLVIIPDGELHNIPFAALNRPNSVTYNPLLTNHEITNLPSASTIAILRTTTATKPHGPKQIAILADPIFSKDDPRLLDKPITISKPPDIAKPPARSRDLPLARLPFTATEANGILNLVQNPTDRTAAFGFDASYDWITNPKLSQYRYVHLATHGIFDQDSPALSSIVLSSINPQGRDRKAYLRLPELFNLNLPTELIVLSACQTGLGKDIPGEGLVGMTRGLMYAGALRVSVSLWNVDDKSTSDLMQTFYTNLWQSNQSHAAALRNAQLALWNQGKAPYYWAAFTLQGEWRN